MGYKNIDFTSDIIACISHYGDNARLNYICEGFYQTGILIYDSIKENKVGVYEDDLVYPYLHNIRHYYELKLKAIAYLLKGFIKKYKSQYITIDYTNFDKICLKHDLKEIFNLISTNIFLIDNSVGDELNDDINGMNNILIDFYSDGELDPFRYATDREGNETLPNIDHVSINKAYNDLKSFHDKADNVEHFIEDLFDEYSLNTQYKTLSRRDIIDIAMTLPPYSNWAYDKFDDIKNSIKTKYNISSNTLQTVIEKIKNSRYLSYCINYQRENKLDNWIKIKPIIDYALKCYAVNKKIPTISIASDMRNIKEEAPNSFKEFKAVCNKDSSEECVLLFTYFLMSNNNSKPEEFDTTYSEASKIIKDDLVNSKLSYFKGKVTSDKFLTFVLNGMYFSGDFELFMVLYEYIKKDFESPHKAYFENLYLNLKEFDKNLSK